MPYRIAAPPEPDPPEREEPWVAVLRSQERRTRIGALAAVALVGGIVAFASFAPKHAANANAPTVEERNADARDAIFRARDRIAAEQVRFETVVRAAIDEGLVARPELGACPIALTKPSGSLHGRLFPMLVLDAHDLGTIPSQAVAGVLVDVRRAEKLVGEGRYEEAALYARALESKDRLRHEVVVVTTTHVKPEATSSGTYKPGEIAGRAYLYDFATRSVVCAADVATKSADSIDYSFISRPDALPSSGAFASLTASLERDLDRRLAIAVAESLVSRAGR